MRAILLAIVLALIAVVPLHAQNAHPSYDYCYRSGVSAYENDDYDKAVKYFNKAIDMRPDDGYSYYYLACSYYYVYSDYEKAINCFVW